MLLAGDAPEPQDGPADPLRQVKLRLPVEQVMKLHRLRILRSEPISDFVATALDEYFEAIKAQRAAAHAEAAR
jgi:hypothetical protein